MKWGGRLFYSFTRVSMAIQLTFQALPPSVENDCSNLIHRRYQDKTHPRN